MILSRVTLALLTVLMASYVNAAYITDKLVAGLYKEAKVSDKPVKALSSGTPLEVVSRKDDFVKVKTSDGTVGWVEATYLTDEKPARSMLLDAQAKVSQLHKQVEKLGKGQSGSIVGEQDLSDLQEKLTKAQGEISQLEIQLKAAKLNNKKFDETQQTFEKEKQQLAENIQAQSDKALAALKKENADLREQISRVGQILKIPVASSDVVPEPVGWQDDNSIKLMGGITAIAIIIGFAGGFFYMRHKIARRFGGMFRL